MSKQTAIVVSLETLVRNWVDEDVLFYTEASMDPRNVEIKSPWPSYFMLTCLGIPRHDDKKYVNMST